MFQVIRQLVLGFGLAAILLAANFSTGLAATKSKTAKPALDPEMTFVIVRRSSPDCEPNCPQWIAAEGRIAGSTAQKLRKVLKSVGKSRLPIIITSGGGDVDASLAMGTMIRERGLTVAVGLTDYIGCAPADKTCKLPKEQQGVYRGFPQSTNGYCYSACVFVLASGSQRLVGLPAAVGVHQITTERWTEKVFYRETYRMVHGKKKVINRKVTKRKIIKNKPTTKLSKALRQQLTRYVKTMGIAPEFMAYLDRAGPESIYKMQQADLTATRLRTNSTLAEVLSLTTICRGTAPAPQCVVLKQKTP